MKILFTKQTEITHYTQKQSWRLASLNFACSFCEWIVLLSPIIELNLLISYTKGSLNDSFINRSNLVFEFNWQSLSFVIPWIKTTSTIVSIFLCCKENNMPHRFGWVNNHRIVCFQFNLWCFGSKSPLRVFPWTLCQTYTLWFSFT